MERKIKRAGYSPIIRLPCAEQRATNTQTHTAIVMVEYSFTVLFINKRRFLFFMF